MGEALPPGSTIGILGGGQLGRMLSVAAARLGYRSHVFEPTSDAPAGHVAHAVTTAAYDDVAALREFADAVDVLTYEFENIPTEALDELESLVQIHPGRQALRVSQDRLTEKDYISGLGIAVAPYAAVDDLAGLHAAIDTIGTPSILKTRRFGYDGKGQARLSTEGDAEPAFAAIEDAPAVLEGFVRFTEEISVIVARDRSGDAICFEPGRNVHVDGILRTTTVPSGMADSVIGAATEIATAIAHALSYVGVLGVELFVTDEGLIVNEIAPRVHNSGHWTQNGCAVDQFEQHVRAVTGWPLGDPVRHADVVMHNLIGHDVDDLSAYDRAPNAALHLYGKSVVKDGRKMGHVNVTGSTNPR